MNYQNQLLEQADELFENFKQAFEVEYGECSYYDANCSVYYFETLTGQYKFTVELVDGKLERHFEILN